MHGSRGVLRLAAHVTHYTRKNFRVCRNGNLDSTSTDEQRSRKPKPGRRDFAARDFAAGAPHARQARGRVDHQRVCHAGGAGGSRPTGGPHAADRISLSGRRRQAALLSVDGIPHGPGAGRHLVQSAADGGRPAGFEFDGRRPGQGAGERARRRAGQWRPGTAGCLFSGVDGDDGHAGLWLRHRLRVRPVQAGDRQRISAGKTRPLEGERNAVRDSPPRAGDRDSALRPGGEPAQRRRGLPADLDRLQDRARRSERHAGGRLQRRDGEFSAPVQRPRVG